jgi:hypothetical protein
MLEVALQQFHHTQVQVVAVQVALVVMVVVLQVAVVVMVQRHQLAGLLSLIVAVAVVVDVLPLAQLLVHLVALVAVVLALEHRLLVLLVLPILVVVAVAAVEIITTPQVVQVVLVFVLCPTQLHTNLLQQQALIPKPLLAVITSLHLLVLEPLLSNFLKEQSNGTFCKSSRRQSNASYRCRTRILHNIRGYKSR